MPGCEPLVQADVCGASSAARREEIDAGPLPSCQLAVARDGELVHVATLGKATDDNRYLTFSVTKALVAAAVWVADRRRAALGRRHGSASTSPPSREPGSTP